jgi:hypothetical protein
MPLSKNSTLPPLSLLSCGRSPFKNSAADSRHSEGRAFWPEESAFPSGSIQSTSRFLAVLGMTTVELGMYATNFCYTTLAAALSKRVLDSCVDSPHGANSSEKFNERSQEVFENKGDRFIANCKAKRYLKTKDLFL